MQDEAVTLVRLCGELWCLYVPLSDGGMHSTNLEIKDHENLWKVAGPIVALIESCFCAQPVEVQPELEPEQELVAA